MNETTGTMDQRVELDSRSGFGLVVRLLWCRQTNQVSVEVTDKSLGDTFEIEVRPGTSPRDVFLHPYAHAARMASQGAERLMAS